MAGVGREPSPAVDESGHSRSQRFNVGNLRDTSHSVVATRPAAMADDPASASNVWMAVLPLISDVSQAEVRMPAMGRQTATSPQSKNSNLSVAQHISPAP